jgi:hypothetical protein
MFHKWNTNHRFLYNFYYLSITFQSTIVAIRLQKIIIYPFIDNV